MSQTAYPPPVPIAEPAPAIEPLRTFVARRWRCKKGHTSQSFGLHFNLADQSRSYCLVCLVEALGKLGVEQAEQAES
jgi:hypothetical protein